MSNTIHNTSNYYSDKELATIELMKAYPSSPAYIYQKSKLVLQGVPDNKLPYSSKHLITKYGGWNKAKIHYGIETGYSPQTNSTKRKTRKNIHGEEFTEHEILEAVRKYPIYKDYLKAAYTFDKTIPTDNTVRTFFGSWTAARMAATGQAATSSNSNPDKPTIVYLVWFPNDELLSCDKTMGWKDNVHKVGITQRSIEERGKSWPDFHIVQEITTTLEEALLIEEKTLEFYSKTKWKFPPLEGNGWSECFISFDIPELQK